MREGPTSKPKRERAREQQGLGASGLVHLSKLPCVKKEPILGLVWQCSGQEHLPCKYEDQSSNPQLPYKTLGMVVHTKISSLGRQTGGSQECADQSAYVNQQAPGSVGVPVSIKGAQ